MIEDLPERIYRDADGHLYRVTLERAAARADTEAKYIVFERLDQSWDGSAPIWVGEALWALTQEDLDRYLEIALTRQ